MAKSKLKTYIVIREYHTLEGMVHPGEEVELTEERAVELAGKVRLRTAAESVAPSGGSPKELAAANKKVAALEGDVESLTADKTALETKVKEQEGQLEQAATDKTALETRVQELEGQLEQATKPDGDVAGESGAGESAKDTKKPSKAGGKNDGKNNN